MNELYISILLELKPVELKLSDAFKQITMITPTPINLSTPRLPRPPSIAQSIDQQTDLMANSKLHP